MRFTKGETTVEIPVLVERSTEGFRASTTSPIALAAVGLTEEAALDALSGELHEQLQNGSRIRTLKVLDVEAIKAQGARIAANPLYGEYLASIEEYRRVHNQVPDAD